MSPDARGTQQSEAVPQRSAYANIMSKTSEGMETIVRVADKIRRHEGPTDLSTSSMQPTKNDSKPCGNKNTKVKWRPKHKNMFEIEMEILSGKASQNQICGTEIGLVKLRSDDSVLASARAP